MGPIRVSEARDRLYRLVDEAAVSHEPIVIAGDLAGAFSRRINIQHRLVYQVPKQARTVKVLRMWTHYEQR